MGIFAAVFKKEALYQVSKEIKQSKSSSNGIVLAITAALLWGVSGTFAQFLFRERGINVEWLVTIRLLISGVVFMGIALFNKDKGLTAIWKNKKDVFSFCCSVFLG